MSRTDEVEALEAYFLNHDDPYFELIAESNSEAEGMRFARSALNEDYMVYDDIVLEAVVRKIMGGDV